MAEKKPYDAEIDDDPYDEESVERMVEDDQLEAEEAGFMEGYQDPKLLKCRVCGKDAGTEDAVELEDPEGRYLFCSEECRQRFLENRGKSK